VTKIFHPLPFFLSYFFLPSRLSRILIRLPDEAEYGPVACAPAKISECHYFHVFFPPKYSPYNFPLQQSPFYFLSVTLPPSVDVFTFSQLWDTHEQNFRRILSVPPYQWLAPLYVEQVVHVLSRGKLQIPSGIPWSTSRFPGRVSALSHFYPFWFPNSLGSLKVFPSRPSPLEQISPFLFLSRTSLSPSLNEDLSCFLIQHVIMPFQEPPHCMRSVVPPPDLLVQSSVPPPQFRKSSLLFSALCTSCLVFFTWLGRSSPHCCPHKNTSPRSFAISFMDKFLGPPGRVDF